MSEESWPEDWPVEAIGRIESLEDERDALSADNGRLLCQCEALGGDNAALAAHCDHYEGEIKRLRSALEKYGSHLLECTDADTGECNCGYRAALAQRKGDEP